MLNSVKLVVSKVPRCGGRTSSSHRYCVTSTTTCYSCHHHTCRCFGTTTTPTTTTDHQSSSNKETITIDAAMAALYSKLPRGESWDRQPEDLRLMNGTDMESMVRLFLLFVWYPLSQNDARRLRFLYVNYVS